MHEKLLPVEGQNEGFHSKRRLHVQQLVPSLQVQRKQSNPNPAGSWGPGRGRTFADFQINGVVDVLAQFLAASGFFKDKALQMEHQHGGQLFQRHSPADLNLNPKETNRRETSSPGTLYGDAQR